MANMTDKQMQFITWLITDSLRNCKDMDEVRAKSDEIVRRSSGMGPNGNEKEDEEEK